MLLVRIPTFSLIKRHVALVFYDYVLIVAAELPPKPLLEGLVRELRSRLV